MKPLHHKSAHLYEVDNHEIVTPLISGIRWSRIDLWGKDAQSPRASVTSAVSEHLRSTQHHFDPEKFKILAKEHKDYSNTILEDIHIRKSTHRQSGQGFGVRPRLGQGSPLKKGTQLQTINI